MKYKFVINNYVWMEHVRFCSIKAAEKCFYELWGLTDFFKIVPDGEK
jgi:hypothetical protein